MSVIPFGVNQTSPEDAALRALSSREAITYRAENPESSEISISFNTNSPAYKQELEKQIKEQQQKANTNQTIRYGVAGMFALLALAAGGCAYKRHLDAKRHKATLEEYEDKPRTTSDGHKFSLDWDEPQNHNI